MRFPIVINSNLNWSYLASFQRYCRFPEKNDPTSIFHPNFRGVPFVLEIFRLLEILGCRSEIFITYLYKKRTLYPPPRTQHTHILFRGAGAAYGLYKVYVDIRSGTSLGRRRRTIAIVDFQSFRRPDLRNLKK